MLAAKVEDMINTVVRQIAFYSFERKVHVERRNGELTADKLVRALDVGAGRDPRPGDPPRAQATRASGPTSRTSSIRRSTSTPMPSAIAW